MKTLKYGFATLFALLGGALTVAGGSSCSSVLPKPFVEYECPVTTFVPGGGGLQCESSTGKYPKTQKVNTVGYVVERSCSPGPTDSGIIQTRPGTPACIGQIHACSWITRDFTERYPPSTGALIICAPELCLVASDHQELYFGDGPLGGPQGGPLNWPDPVDFLIGGLMRKEPGDEPLTADGGATIDPLDAGWMGADASVGPLECNDSGVPPMPSSMSCGMTVDMTGGTLSSCADCFLASCCDQYMTASTATNEGANALADVSCWLGQNNPGQFPCPSPLLPAVQTFDACMVVNCLSAGCTDPHTTGMRKIPGKPSR